MPKVKNKRSPIKRIVSVLAILSVLGGAGTWCAKNGAGLADASNITVVAHQNQSDVKQVTIDLSKMNEKLVNHLADGERFSNSFQTLQRRFEDHIQQQTTMETTLVVKLEMLQHSTDKMGAKLDKLYDMLLSDHLSDRLGGHKVAVKDTVDDDPKSRTTQ